jgi:transposase InsO family protein
MSDVISQGTAVPRKGRKYGPEFRKKVIDRYLVLGSLSATSKEFGVSQSAVHKWHQRFSAGGITGLVDKSSRPNHQPRKTAQWLIDKVLGLKRERPELGGSATSDHLARFEAVKLSANTIHKIFKKHNLPDSDQALREARYKVVGDPDRKVEHQLEAELGEWERFARPNPNDMWQMDIMSFYIRDAHRVYLISALDDCSRMIVSWGLFKEQTADNVLEVLRTGLMRFGAPGEVLTDQGAQFKHWGGVTQFEKLLRKLNIQHVKARAHHPQTCGKIEAFHKTIHRELIDQQFFISQEQATEKISRFIEHYNYGRPHSSLEGFTPADRYFGVIAAVKKYLSDIAVPKNEEEARDGKIGIGRGSRVYLIGKVLDMDVRIQELAGNLSLHVNNHLYKELSLTH